MLKRDFIKLCVLQLLCGLALDPVGLLASGRQKSRQVSKQSTTRKALPKKSVAVSSSTESEDPHDTGDEEEKIPEGSLFLRARKPYKGLEEGKMECDFAVGSRNYERGKFICIANPTYDLTFKSLFLGRNDVAEDDLASPDNANKRLISLLNSLVYPKAKEYIISIKIVGGTILIAKELAISGEKRARTESPRENAMMELRCDIVCECTVVHPGRETQQESYVLYFDIEMQRRNVGNPLKRFLNYQKKLQQTNREIRVIGFLDYFTISPVEKTKMGRLVEDPQTGELVAAPEEKRSMDLHPMIGLRASVEDILKGEDIEIVKGCKIGQTGKEWLKLLGVRWWAEEDTNRRECYRVPSEVQTKEMADALEILKTSNVDEEIFRMEIDRVSEAQEMLDELEANKKQEGLEEGRAEGLVKGRAEGLEEGEMIGIIKSLVRGFVKGRGIEDDEVEEIGKNSLGEDFVREIWSALPNIPDSKDVEDFIEILRDKNLLKDG
ncbi:MAG: hypothetical protein LBF34_04945 [Puniceicoccales bacterium]|nr:hypothetical protein [Puniceicoccales bacterium]